MNTYDGRRDRARPDGVSEVAIVSDEENGERERRIRRALLLQRFKRSTNLEMIIDRYQHRAELAKHLTRNWQNISHDSGE